MSDLPPPPAETLRHGDLLWPKKGYVPYLLNDEAAEYAEEKALWEAEQRAFRDQGRPEDLSQEEFDFLSELTFDEFRQAYGEEQTAPAFMGGGVSVGHVAIVEMMNGVPHVVEAVPKGVVRGLYADWARNHSDHKVWHGRLRAPVADAPDRFVQQAAEQVGKPYSFWRFRLTDTRGFYCSKLVWYAAYRAFGIALDGNMSPRRGFWYSPKQLTRSSYVEMLQEDGPYE